jgi:hypothetical protein
MRVCFVSVFMLVCAFGEVSADVLISQHFSPAAYTATDIDEEDVIEDRDRFDFDLEGSFSGRLAVVEKGDKQGALEGVYIDVSRYRLQDTSGEKDTYQTLTFGALGGGTYDLFDGVEAYGFLGLGVGAARFRVSDAKENIYGNAEVFIESGVMLGETVFAGVGAKGGFVGFPGETVANSFAVYGVLGLRM